MQTSYIGYDVQKSAERIKAILAASNSSFQEVDAVPSRDKLTFTNGFYVKVSALFMDIRGSSELTGEHRRPRLARLYRSYISESVAVLNGFLSCKEVNIVGDCVSGIFEGSLKSQVDEVFSAAAKLNTLLKILNHYYKKNGIVEVTVGMGISFGRALMVKAGYSGSNINDVVWMGDVVNDASNMCGRANKDYSYSILLSEDIHDNLSDENKDLVSSVQTFPKLYGANVVNVEMEEWFKENCSDDSKGQLSLYGGRW